MTEVAETTRSVILEREIAHPPERVWRALTQPHPIAEWLMTGDFTAVSGSSFEFRAEWGTVRGEVLEIEPERLLSYSWGDDELESVVTWTLVPTGTGTRLRIEQTGFRADQPRYYHGAKAGWPRFLTALEQLLGRME